MHRGGRHFELSLHRIFIKACSAARDMQRVVYRLWRQQYGMCLCSQRTG